MTQAPGLTQGVLGTQTSTEGDVGIGQEGEVKGENIATPGSSTLPVNLGENKKSGSANLWKIGGAVVVLTVIAFIFLRLLKKA